MKDDFENYILNLVHDTFGFQPLIRTEMPNAGVIKIFLDGSEDERKQMMGYHAQNFHALKQMLICFSKKYKVYVFLYLEFPNALNTTHY